MPEIDPDRDPKAAYRAALSEGIGRILGDQSECMLLAAAGAVYWDWDKLLPRDEQIKLRDEVHHAVTGLLKSYGAEFPFDCFSRRFFKGLKGFCPDCGQGLPQSTSSGGLID